MSQATAAPPIRLGLNGDGVSEVVADTPMAERDLRNQGRVLFSGREGSVIRTYDDPEGALFC